MPMRPICETRERKLSDEALSSTLSTATYKWLEWVYPGILQDYSTYTEQRTVYCKARQDGWFVS